MRIGIDCRLWNESGVGRYTRNLIKNLKDIDRENEYVLFVLLKDQKEILKQSMKQVQDRVQNDKFNIVISDIRWHTIEEQLRLTAILNKEGLDLVHFPYVSVPIFYNKPFVVTIHDLILHHFPTGEASTLPLPLYYLKHLAYKYVIKHAAQKAEKIITLSKATKDEIIEHLKVDPKKIIVTYEGAFDKSKVKSQKSKVQVKSKKYFLYVGNAYPHKNIDRLIKAFSLFCHPELVSGSESNRDSDRRQNDIKLILVGREDYFYKRLKEKVKKMGLGKSVIFLGEVSNEQLSSLYKNALALIIPSLMEGFGLPALEAMANRCLVLASDIPSLKEICGDAAIYFDPYDVQDIVNKMIVVYHSNDSNHYNSVNIKKGIERTKRFSWQKMAEETLKVYESCAGV
jgi:glycosyltransferase involved in cell wall biosynthesis